LSGAGYINDARIQELFSKAIFQGHHGRGDKQYDELYIDPANNQHRLKDGLE